MIAIHMLEEQRSNELARPLDLVCWNGGNVRDICQEEENGHSDERDYARIAYGTDRIRALDFIQDIESVRPADECVSDFNEPCESILSTSSIDESIAERSILPVAREPPPVLLPSNGFLKLAAGSWIDVAPARTKIPVNAKLKRK